MRNSISFLPARQQTELKYAVDLIRERLPQAEMIFLYGDLADENYVIPDSTIEDFQLLVVTRGLTYKEVGKILDEVEDHYKNSPETDNEILIVSEDIDKFNEILSEEGEYFYTRIIRERVQLYNSGNCELVTPREFSYAVIRERAQEYYDENFEIADDFLLGATMYYDKGLYKRTAFLLHQASENYYYCIRLVFTLKETRQHNLEKYYKSIRKYCKALRPFSNPEPEVARLFHLVKNAYGDALHNPDFTATKEDVDGLFPMVYLLRDITAKECAGKIEEFRRKAEQQQ